MLLASTGAWAQGVFGVPQAVGTASTAQSVTVTAQLAGKVNKVEILTLGASGLDFAGVSGASTCPSANLAAAGQQCTESVTFTPAAPGLRVGAVVLLDLNGNLLGTALLSGTGSGGLGALVSGNILPVAGNGNYKDAVVDGIAATLAELYLPSGVTLDGAGNLYIADTLHNRIRMVCASATSATISGTAAACTGPGIITTIAGNGDTGYTGDGKAASAATLSSPSGVALDGAGNLYIADTGNNAVRKITAATGIIATVAGTGVPGYTADGIAATASGLNGPQSITIDSAGNLFIADTLDQRIRRVDAVSGIISTAAGNGTAGFNGDTLLATSVNTELNFPDAVAFDAQSNMYIADSLNNRVREVNGATGIIDTFAGNGLAGDIGDGMLANGAELDAPSGVAVDAAGNVYIADTQNNAIRKVTAAGNVNPGIISTIAANVSGEFYFNGAFAPVNIHGPLGIFLDSSANLYFADSLNMTVREIQSNFVAIDLTQTPTRQGALSATQDETVANVGNAPLKLTAPDIFVDTNDPEGVNAALDPATTTCPMTNPFLADEADCVIGAVFAPSLSLVFGSGVSSEPLNANIDIGKSGDTLNSPLDIELVGVATPLNSTSVALTSSLNPSQFGQSVTFTATVTTGTGSLTGTVTFFDGATTLAANVAVSGGVATYTTAALAVGTHAITATYNGDKLHFTSTGTLTPPQVVNEATTTTLAAVPASPSALGASVTFTATVTSGGGGVPLDGTVTFTNGAAALCNAAPLTLTAGVYTAVCSTTAATALAQGVNTITAAYIGDAANYILASSAPLLQDVQATSTTVLTTSGSLSVFGSTVTFTAVVSGVGPAPTGNVSFTDSLNGAAAAALACAPQPTAPTATCATAALAVGTHTIVASYAGDSNYSASTSNSVTQVVNLAQTTTIVSAVPAPGIAGAPVAITATVTLAGGGSMTGGTVSFADTFNGSTVVLGNPTALSATGTATVNPLLAPGTHSIVATYSGDADGAASISAAYSLTVNQAATQTTVTATPNPALVQATITFTATVASVGGGIPGGTVTFNANGNPIGAPATLDPTGTATITSAALAAGTYTITAVYSGDTNDQTSTGTGAPPLVVGTIPTVTDLGASTTTGANPQVILVAAVLDNAGGSSGSLPVPTGTITFNSGATTLGTANLDSSGVATLVPNLANGTTYNIVAVYSGDPLHSPSTSAAVSINGTASGFNLTVTPNAVTVASGQNVSVNVALASINGFADTIGLGCASLPAGVNCQFSSPSAELAANGIANVTLTIDTNNPLGGGTSAMNAHPGGRGVSLAGLLLPLSALFGCLFWRLRTRNVGWMTLGLVLLLGIAAQLVTGCAGSFSQSSAAAGTYVIQVTGTGATSDVSHYQNVKLTISAK
ncbi:MAG: Ig-like domain repeat protein [Terracidiphilus sp.]